jgi:hypothetical protein
LEYTGYKFDDIMNLAKKYNYKKIMIMRDTWDYGIWCIVDKIIFNPDGKYGKAYGFINYKNGNKKHGEILSAGTYAWIVVKTLEEDLEIVNKLKIEP